MNQKQILQMLREATKNAKEQTDDEGNTFKSAYLGSFMSLDPCGNYHHFLSPNNVTKKCEQFWESLDKMADKLHGYIGIGEGDPTDIYFQLDFKAKEEII
jgi:hypothetical protein